VKMVSGLIKQLMSVLMDPTNCTINNINAICLLVRFSNDGENLNCN